MGSWTFSVPFQINFVSRFVRTNFLLSTLTIKFRGHYDDGNRSTKINGGSEGSSPDIYTTFEIFYFNPL